MVRPHPEGGARAKAFAVSAALRCVRPSRKPAPAQALPYLHRFLKMSRNNDLHQTAPCASPSAGNDPKSRVSPESASRNREMCRYGSARAGRGSPPRLVARLRARSAETRELRAADQYPGHEYQHAADHDLERGREERRVHESIADVGDRDELDHDHGDGHAGRGPETRNEIGERVSEPADGGHHA